MIGTMGKLTLIISVRGLVLHILMQQLPLYSIFQILRISFIFIALSILIFQSIRSMYQGHYQPFMASYQKIYQKIIFFYSNFPMAVIILCSFLLSLSKLLQEY